MKDFLWFFGFDIIELIEDLIESITKKRKK